MLPRARAVRGAYRMTRLDCAATLNWMWSKGTWAAMFVFAWMATGCYSWAEIRPTELEKLNGSYARTKGTVATPSGAANVIEVTVANVERPDGTLMQVSGATDVRITTDSDELIFKVPVDSRVDDTDLIVIGGNRSETIFRLDEVKKVELSMHSPGKTLGLVAGVLVVTLGVTIGALAATAP